MAAAAVRSRGYPKDRRPVDGLVGVTFAAT